ncbi:MAG: hypothetical protein AAGF07_04750 [Patescibacteria group bacterium]
MTDKRTALNIICECIKSDQEAGKYSQIAGILVNEAAFAQLLKEGAIKESFRGEEFEKHKTYFSYIIINNIRYKIMTLPNFHPKIQKLFEIAGQEPVLKTDTHEQADSKKHAVFCTVDRDSELIL